MANLAAALDTAEQTDIFAAGRVAVQAADGVTLTVQRTGKIGDGRPSFEAAGVGNQAAVVV